MVSIAESVSLSLQALSRSASKLSLNDAPSESPARSGSSIYSTATSSQGSLNGFNDEDLTITNKSRQQLARDFVNGNDELGLKYLALSNILTELQYAISDIQTRMFELQELRHRASSASNSSDLPNTIQQLNADLHEKLSSGASNMTTAFDLIQFCSKFPDQTLTMPSELGEKTDLTNLRRKYEDLEIEWNSVVDESDVLRAEIEEDKALSRLRDLVQDTDGLMTTLEKFVNKAQEFVWSVQRNPPGITPSWSSDSNATDDLVNTRIEQYATASASYERNKDHYLKATSRKIFEAEKLVQDRSTKNGEAIRRIAELQQRWKSLIDRISRTDTDMERVRRVIHNEEPMPSETESVTSMSTAHTQLTRNGDVVSSSETPKNGAASALSLSNTISPLRKLAKRFTSSKSPVPATPAATKPRNTRTPQSEPVPTLRRKRTSLFPFKAGQATSHMDLPSSESEASIPETPKNRRVSESSTVRSVPAKQPWNSSTKVEQADPITAFKATPSKRPYAMNMFADAPPVPPLPSPHQRSLSRSSMATSSRPWSPVTSSVSTAMTSNTSNTSHKPQTSRPPSRTGPSAYSTPGRPASRAAPTTPRYPTRPPSRAQTPSGNFVSSHIPTPSRTFMRQVSGGVDDSPPPPLPRRAMSPSGDEYVASPRPPSRAGEPRSMIPILQVSAASRPSSAMSSYVDNSYAFRDTARRAQTPDAFSSRKLTPQKKAPPSSFRDAISRTASSVSGTSSRPSSRAGASTPAFDYGPVHEYIPTNPKDPLDVEVAAIVNSIPHGLLVERVDPPLRKTPADGEEVRAQYAFSNQLGRKVITCKLTTLTRVNKGSGPDVTKKVMCRVGGGWQDLSVYMASR